MDGRPYRRNKTGFFFSGSLCGWTLRVCDDRFLRIVALRFSDKRVCMNANQFEMDKEIITWSVMVTKHQGCRLKRNGGEN